MVDWVTVAGPAHASSKRRKRKVKRCKPVKGKHKAHRPKRHCKPAPKHKAKKVKRKVSRRPGTTTRPAAMPKAAAAAPRPRVQPIPPAPKPVPPKPSTPEVTPNTPTYTGPFGAAQAERLLWRAGFGPSPGHAASLASLGLTGAINSLSRPVGTATLTGAAPTVDGDPIAPQDAWGHDHLWWLDRMVRTNQPLVERMTLIWHDWFATSKTTAGQPLMLAQNATMRSKALGSFKDLALAVSSDPAMILWLNQNENNRWNPNENYARELMELFTLGADRGAYSEDDVRELARALTGWRNDWSAELGDHNFRWDASWHDTASKTVFGKTGNYDWKAGVGLCLDHSLHASFFVQKLWSYFIPTAAPADDAAELERAYVQGGFAVRPIVEAILRHPLLHAGPRMVKPPVVYLAGMLRRMRRAVDTEAWTWTAEGAGQHLFMPPNVAGWDDSRWLDTSTLRARWTMISYLLNGNEIQGAAMSGYSATETAAEAVAAARAYWLGPQLTDIGAQALTTFADTCLPTVMADWEKRQYRATRQNALRQLVASSPDLQTS